ncbi:aconitate hydratase 1 [Enterococcus sp. JM4C]|uniref:aconitate hydratase AcnA n=1 Tax=Candidatus Enterococcus huntleyi TaxID=1857217 RepID=UPI00137A70CC|nr:aconitate hydratase AcnA [Enterococcus sp. JM4C]KAF1295246.1 aconitate hydratase 1 [Enterococcus sp. JM4C]
MKSKKLAKQTLDFRGTPYTYYALEKIATAFGTDVAKLPYTIRILLESLIRQEDGVDITEETIRMLTLWAEESVEGEIPFKPTRVVLQDFTGVPAIVDLASMREAIVRLGGSPDQINPEIPVDLVVDHSVQVDYSGNPQALAANAKLEFERNYERYEFLKWAQNSFDNYQVVPPATGIIHQVNIEFLSEVVVTKAKGAELEIFPDSLVGTDSHTTMINGIGVLGWGVGGIEAEAGMLGEPSYFPIPEVIGVELVGAMQLGATATDVALRVTQLLREEKVVGKFVEFFGAGLKELSLADRATIANMAPEYGATCGFFPIDQETLAYMRLTGRDEAQVQLTEAYAKANHLFYDEHQSPSYTKVLTLDLSTISTNLSGPKRPQDLIPLEEMATRFSESVTAPEGNQGFGLTPEELDKQTTVVLDDDQWTVGTGDLAIAAITSCTNTSNPYVMLAAGLLAKKAVQQGLRVAPTVKTSLAPGSKVVTGYLEESGLLPYLEKLGFAVVGYGCTTCIGNSGPLSPEMTEQIQEANLLVASVLSGNRNFEGRIHPLVKANYLASPPLVVAYALMGTVTKDMNQTPLGTNEQGKPVYLADIWPKKEEIDQYVETYVTPSLFQKYYSEVFHANEDWNQIPTTAEALYNWNAESTYIANPPYFEDMSVDPVEIQTLEGLTALAKFGDSVTTDHISPAGAIAMRSAAGTYLIDQGVSPKDFNSFGSRRGNHEVMMRGTFGNIRIRNQLAPGTEGSFTTYFPTGEVLSIYDAAMKYKQSGKSLIVLAGKDYGMGSSRDWAAKGTNLLGVKAVIAESYERIHRSNLVMMGVLPLQYLEGETAETLGLTGTESFTIHLTPETGIGEIVTVTAEKTTGEQLEFKVKVRFDAKADIRYYQHQGILPMVIRKKTQHSTAAE